MRGGFRPGRLRAPLRPLRPPLGRPPIVRRHYWRGPGCGCLALPLGLALLLALSARVLF